MEKLTAKNGKIHEVVKWPDPVLSKPGEKVTVFDAKLKKLTEEMFESMYAAQGIGLAAPQISISQRITVIDVSFKKNPEEKIVLINPEIIAREGKQVEEEGCLSLPEIRARAPKRFHAWSRNWKRRESRSCWRGRCSMRLIIWMEFCLSIG